MDQGEERFLLVLFKSPLTIGRECYGKILLPVPNTEVKWPSSLFNIVQVLFSDQHDIGLKITHLGLIKIFYFGLQMWIFIFGSVCVRFTFTYFILFVISNHKYIRSNITRMIYMYKQIFENL